MESDDVRVLPQHAHHRGFFQIVPIDACGTFATTVSSSQCGPFDVLSHLRLGSRGKCWHTARMCLVLRR
jgi:hypothetical protein